LRSFCDKAAGAQRAFFRRVFDFDILFHIEQTRIVSNVDGVIQLAALKGEALSFWILTNQSIDFSAALRKVAAKKTSRPKQVCSVSNARRRPFAGPYVGSA